MTAEHDRELPSKVASPAKSCRDVERCAPKALCDNLDDPLRRRRGVSRLCHMRG